jgi:pimeloyl-ACP methyl ester carboxylesterase
MSSSRFCTAALGLVALATAPPAAQVPHADPSYQRHDVEVATADPAIRLAGTLTVPGGAGPHPAVLLMTGDGGHTRDQVISGSPMFAMIADHLSRRGLAVLRLDDRGVGASSGPSVEEATLAERAADMAAALAFLRARGEVDARRVGVLGHSAGGLVATLLAARDSTLAFAVLLGTPGIPGDEVWIRQQIEGLRSHGVGADTVAAVEVQLRRVTDFIKEDYTDDEAFYRIGHAFIAAHGVAEAEITDALVDQLLGGLRNEATRFFFAHDPADDLRQTRVPILAVLGAADAQVFPDQNVLPLTRALLDAGNPDFAVALLPDQDHFFLEHEGRRLDRHAFGEMEVAAELLETVTCWVRGRIGLSASG